MNTMHASHSISRKTGDPSEYNRLVKEAGQLFSRTSGSDDPELQAARRIIQNALQINPSGIKALNLSARIELQAGHIHQARQIINTALRLKPDSPSVLYSAGHIALASGNLNQAEKHFSASVKISRVATRSASSLAYVYLEQGKYLEAFQAYRELIKTHADDPHIRAKLFESASHMVADFYAEELENDLLRYFSFPSSDFSLLRGLTTSLLHHKLQISDASTPLEFEQIATDPLLLASLTTFCFCDATMERLFITLRQSILFSAARSMNISEEHMSFALALATQARMNEFVWPVTPQETEILDQLEELLVQVDEQEQWSPSDIAPALVMLALYRHPADLKLSGSLGSSENKNWANNLHELVVKPVVMRQKEIKAAAHIPYWRPATGTNNAVSQKVRAQYETNPYPRWQEIGFNTPDLYRRALSHNFPELNLKHWQHKPQLELLVAGCGTGRHAIRLAGYFRDLNVTAIDLSSRALSYAQQKAKDYNIHNIRFIQADILDFTTFPCTFDVIECSGVLHHMESPAEGLSALNNLLSATGIMKIALYSKTARKQIIALRALLEENQQKNIDPHLLRHAILLNQLPGNWDDIRRSPDFYTMSNCRDLIFHEQEHQFDTDSIASLLSDNDMEFIGMLPPNTKRQVFEKEHGSLISGNTLDNWGQFEKTHPDTFDGMYQFYCQKKSNISCI